MIDDIIYEALSHAIKFNKPNNKKMNILIQNIDQKTVEKINELLKEDITEEEKVLKKYTPYDRAVWREKKQRERANKGIREMLDKQQKAESVLEIIGKLRTTIQEALKEFETNWDKPKAGDIRSFDLDAVDDSYNNEVGK